MDSNPDKTEVPFWWQAAAPETRDISAPESLPADCDVAIVGAGYTGLCAALYLAKAGKQVVVLDSQAPGWGASSRNGGIASGNLRLNIETAIRNLGETATRRLLAESVAARAHLRELIENNGIDCDYQLNGRFTGALTETDLNSMSAEIDRFRELTGVEAYSIGKSELSQYIGSEIYVGGVVRPDIAHFHPAKLHRGIMRAARTAGARVQGHCAVEKLERKGTKFKLSTALGELATSQVLMATNGYNSALDRWLKRRVVPVKSRIIVTETLSRNLVSTLMPNLRAMGENRNLYRYFRPLPDGDRLLFGSREPVFDSSHRGAVEHVRKGMTEVFPDLADAKVASSWAGNVAFTRQDWPMMFQRNGIHYALGYCGSGTVWAPWFGKQIAGKMLEESGENNLADLTPNSAADYAAKSAYGDEASTRSAFFCDPPPAVPLYNGTPWFLPSAMFWHGLQDRLRGRH